MTVSDIFLGFLGFGHMAQGICKRIEESRLIPRSQMLFVRRNPDKARHNSQTFGVSATSLETLVERSNVLLVAVRPDQLADLTASLQRLEISKGTLIATLVAGVKHRYYEENLGPFSTVRVMPNVASSVGEGMTLLSYNEHMSAEWKSLSNILFSCLGQVAEIQEAHMDAASAIAGCGPAFVMRLIESAAQMGVDAGLSYKEALKISAQTFLGASKMILSGSDPKEQIAKIAVPNGMTEAGLKVMTLEQIDPRFQQAIQAASQRSKEFSQESY